MKKLIFPAALLCSSIFFSCAESEQRKGLDAKEERLKEEAAAPQKEHVQRAYYPIPSPEQMFGFINDNGVKYSKELTNNIENVRNYTQPTEKALNFGIYTADLAYTAAYQDIETTIDLYKVVKRLSAELNIEEMMTEEMMENMQANMEQPDSLAVIAGDSYYQAVEFLEQNGQRGKLALMSLGGWIESLYITMSAISSFEEGSSTANRIASQKITFGNLYTYLKKNEDEVGVPEAIKDVQKIRGVFASLIEERAGKAAKDESGKLVIGRGKKITMTKAQFDELKTAVSDYRTSIVGNAS